MTTLLIKDTDALGDRVGSVASDGDKTITLSSERCCGVEPVRVMVTYEPAGTKTAGFIVMNIET